MTSSYFKFIITIEVPLNTNFGLYCASTQRLVSAPLRVYTGRSDAVADGDDHITPGYCSATESDLKASIQRC